MRPAAFFFLAVEDCSSGLGPRPTRMGQSRSRDGERLRGVVRHGFDPGPHHWSRGASAKRETEAGRGLRAEQCGTRHSRHDRGSDGPYFCPRDNHTALSIPDLDFVLAREVAAAAVDDGRARSCQVFAMPSQAAVSLPAAKWVVPPGARARRRGICLCFLSLSFSLSLSLALALSLLFRTGSRSGYLGWENCRVRLARAQAG